MVAVAWDKIEFNIPETLQSFEPPRAASPTFNGRSRSNIEVDWSFHKAAQVSCPILHNATLQTLIPSVQTLANFRERNQLIQQYNQVLSRMMTMQKDFSRFLVEVWAFDNFDINYANSPLELAAAKRARENWLDEGLKNSVFQPVGFQSIVTAEFASKHGSDLRKPLAEDLQNLSVLFAQSCAQQLLDLVGVMAIGLAQWYPGNNCRYIYFRRNVSAFFEKCSKAWPLRDGIAQHELECHEHHLIDAFVCHPNNAPIPVPDSIQELLEKAPSWLQGHIRLIAGTMTQEVVRKKVVKEEDWSYDRYTGALVPDPAIAIGEFVLTGWGPQDTNDIEGPRNLPYVSPYPRPQKRTKKLPAPVWKKMLGGE